MNFSKVAKDVPKFKIETKLLCNNYRPIFSLLLNTVNIIEKMMHQGLNFLLEQYNCYHSFQFDLRLSYSTSSTLMSIVKNIQTQLDSGQLRTGAFVNQRKAFDIVDHRVLI